MVNCIVIVKPVLRRPSSTPATQLCVIFSTTHPSAKAFRINTCKTLSKQTTLTSFGIHTYEKGRGRGNQDVNALRYSKTGSDSPRPSRQCRRLQTLAGSAAPEGRRRSFEEPCSYV